MKSTTELLQIESKVATLRTLARLEATRPTIESREVEDELRTAQRELATYLALRVFPRNVLAGA